MPRLFRWFLLFSVALGIMLSASVMIAAPPPAKGLFVTYPPAQHETTASQIFLIGTAPPQRTVQVNGQAIARNRSGHFAPSFPLQLGVNRFTLRYGTQEQQLTITRSPLGFQLPANATFAPDSLLPAVNLGKQPNEPFCFAAAAAPGSQVSVKLADQTIPLPPQTQSVDLPANQAVLTNQNQPISAAATTLYQGCAQTVILGDLGQPMFEFSVNGNTTRQPAPGKIHILSPTELEIAEVTAENGTARTGGSTDYSRLTPLPKGTQAVVTGYEGEWLRLDYGGWIKKSEVQIRKASAPPTSIIRSIKARPAGEWTEVVFPLQVPVPIAVQQGDRTFTLTLYNTTAQTDTIKLDDDPLIARLDWQQVRPGQVQYVFNLKTSQQWGYKLRYEGTSLVLSLKRPSGGGEKAEGRGQKAEGVEGKGSRGAGEQGGKGGIQNSKFKIQNSKFPLSGIKILLDPGHGGPEDLGARGPTGYPEKSVALITSGLVREELVKRGATVVMTRTKDVDVDLNERVKLIGKEQPAIALSLHYNALPDNGDALNTKGVATFWYHAQAHSLAVFLHNYLVKRLNRPSYGVFWNNLALTRPANTPSVLLELGFMINPDEFDWIVNPREQQKLANAIAEGITQWFQTRS